MVSGIVANNVEAFDVVIQLSRERLEFFAQESGEVAPLQEDGNFLVPSSANPRKPFDAF